MIRARPWRPYAGRKWTAIQPHLRRPGGFLRAFVWLYRWRCPRDWRAA